MNYTYNFHLKYYEFYFIIKKAHPIIKTGCAHYIYFIPAVTFSSIVSPLSKPSNLVSAGSQIGITKNAQIAVAIKTIAAPCCRATTPENNSISVNKPSANELEIIEFEMGNNRYGINVIKVKEIILPMNVTVIPHSHPSIEGIIQLRGEVLPVINMESVLGMAPRADKSEDKYIVTAFNKQQVVFHFTLVSYKKKTFTRLIVNVFFFLLKS